MANLDDPPAIPPVAPALRRWRERLLRPAVLAAPLILWWAYFVRKAYLPHGTGKVWPKIAPLFHLPWPLTLKPWWLDFFLAVVLTFAALSIGNWLLARVKLESSAGDRALVGTATGFMLLLLAASSLSLLRLFTALSLGILAGAFVLLGLFFAREALRTIAELGRGLARAVRHEPASFLYLVLCVLFLFFGFVLAAAPETSFDALNVHLFYPRLFMAKGYFYLADTYRTTTPLYAQVLYTLGLALHGPHLAKFLNFLFLPGLLLCTFQIVKALLAEQPRSTSAGLLAGLMVASCPSLLHHSGICYPDLATAFFSVVASYGVIRFLQSGARPWLWFGALSAGFAAGTKYAGLYFIAILALVLAVGLFRKKGWRESVKVVLCYGLLAGVVAGPWYLRNWYYTGDPVHPTLHRFVKKPVLDPNDAAFLMQDAMNRAREPLSARTLLTLPWLLTTKGEQWQGAIGPVFLWSLPLILLGCSFSVPWISTSFILAAFSLFWVIGPQWIRYFLPGIPLLAALAVVGIYHSRMPALLRILWAGMAVAFALVNLPGLNPTWVSGGDNVMATIPYEVGLGGVSEDEYLRSQVVGYEAAQFLNRLALPAETRILPVGENFLPFFSRYDMIDIFENFRIVCYNEKGEYVGCFELSSDTLRTNMDRHRVGVVSIRRGWAWIKSVLALRLEDPFLRSDYQFLSYVGGYFLYRRAPGGPRSGARYVNVDLLYRFAMHSDARGSDPFDVRLGDQKPLGGETRMGLIILPPNEVTYRVRLGESPQLSFALGMNPQAAAMASGTELSVYVRPTDGEAQRIFSQRFLPQDAAHGWVPFTVDLSAYTGQECFVTLRTEPLVPGGHDWLAIADPVIYATESDAPVWESTVPFVFESESQRHPVEVKFTPDKVRSGVDEYTIEIPSLANSEIDLLSSIRGRFPEAAEKFCRLDAHGRAKLFAPAGIPPGVIQVVGVRPRGRQRWLAAHGSVEVVP